MFTKYKDGAEEEIEVVAYVKLGAEQEAEAVYKYEDGAEVEVWSNTQDLYMLSHDTTTGAFYSNEGDWDNDFWCVAVDDLGEIILVVDGEFTNPTISFTYSGGANYSTSSGAWRDISAGYIYSYDEQNGVAHDSYNRQTVGGSSGFSEDVSVEYTLEGTYERVGLRIKFINWQISPDSQGNICPSYIFIKNVMIDGKKYVTRNEDSYDYKDF